MRGDVGAREIDDVGDQALSFAEVKALATGNPLIMERAGVAAEVAKLGRLRAAHHTDQSRLTRTRDTSGQRATLCRRTAAACDTAIATRVDTRADRFTATINRVVYTARPDAAAALRDTALERARGLRAGDRSFVTAITVGGVSIDIAATKDLVGTYVELRVTGVPTDPIRLDLDELRQPNIGPGLLTRLENRVQRLDRTRDELIERADTEDRQAEQAGERVGRPFEHEQRLTTLTRRLDEIDTQLTPIGPAPAGETDAPSPQPVADAGVGL
jgi:hypothetical protein